MNSSAAMDFETVLLGTPFYVIFAILFCLSFLTACAAFYLYARMTSPDRTNSRAHTNLLMTGQSAFLFSAGKLVFATTDGHRLLDKIETGGASWDKLSDHFRTHNPEICDNIETLNREGSSFQSSFIDNDGVEFDVVGKPQNGLIHISIMERLDRTAGTRRHATDQNPQLDAMEQIAGQLDAVSFPMWTRNTEGQILWGNDQLKNLVEPENPTDLKLPSAFVMTDDDAGDVMQKRVSLNGQDQEQNWFTLVETPTRDGNIIGYALQADDIVKVETSLRRFVATLTESFAQLSTGLAIFDANRRLTIFNPALSDLMQIDPGWLATSPNFRDFMGRAREGQMLPAQKTPADWKKMIKSIEEGAANGSLSQKWALPSGQTFCVTGRPHPHGAIALMIEDISTHISLERQYRSEIEQSRTTLDHLSEAVCIFDTTGAMVYANAAFADLWSIDIKTKLTSQNIVSITADWGAACKPTPVWGDLREFVTSLDQRASWTSDVELLDGRKFNTLFAPLPDGSTLTTFSKLETQGGADIPNIGKLATISRSQAEEISILELAIEHMREAFKTATPASNDPSQLKDAMSYADRLLLLRHDTDPDQATPIDALSHDLNALLHEKDATLNLSCDNIIDGEHLSPEHKRLLINVMLVVRALVAPNENVDLSIADMNDGISLSCLFRGLPNADISATALGLPYRILHRSIADCEGEFRLNRLDERGILKISCTVPTRPASSHSTTSEPTQLKA